MELFIEKDNDIRLGPILAKFLEIFFNTNFLLIELRERKSNI